MNAAKPTVLLIGRTMPIIQADVEGVHRTDIDLLMATTLDEVKHQMSRGAIDGAIIGAGIDLPLRLDIVRVLLEAEGSTTVHLKDHDSGPEGMLPFTRSLIDALFAPRQG